MASRDKVDVDTFHKGIQYALERLGKSTFSFESTTVSNFKSKSHEGSGNELVDYSRAPCLGADQKARGLWERDWYECRMCHRTYSCQAQAADQNLLLKNLLITSCELLFHPYSTSVHKEILQNACSKSPGGRGCGEELP